MFENMVFAWKIAFFSIFVVVFLFEFTFELHDKVEISNSNFPFKILQVSLVQSKIEK